MCFQETTGWQPNPDAVPEGPTFFNDIIAPAILVVLRRTEMKAVEALALVGGHVDEELLKRNEYLAAESEIRRSARCLAPSRPPPHIP